MRLWYTKILVSFHQINQGLSVDIFNATKLKKFNLVERSSVAALKLLKGWFYLCTLIVIKTLVRYIFASNYLFFQENDISTTKVFPTARKKVHHTPFLCLFCHWKCYFSLYFFVQSVLILNSYFWHLKYVQFEFGSFAR